MKVLGRRALGVALLVGAASSVRAQSTLPAQLSDREFWQLTTDVSEPGGYFRSDNFLSNEMGFLYPIPELRRTTRQGGVYMGVGPEQNFTYIVALKPKLAVIFDMRRQNMILHLMYKALLETSPDRATFLARLFSGIRPAGLDSNTRPEAMFGALAAAAQDSAGYRNNLAAIEAHLTTDHGFTLTADD